MTRIAIVAALYVVIFGSGFWLSHGGRPHGAVLLNVHKLISLAALVYLAVIAYRAHRAGAMGAGGLAVTIVTAVVFVATIVTGGLVSLEKEMPFAVRLAHRLTPYLTALASAAMLWLFRGKV